MLIGVTSVQLSRQLPGQHFSDLLHTTLAGDIAFLVMSDAEALNLPKLAQDIVIAYIQQDLCRPPLVLDLTSAVTNLSMSTKVTAFYRLLPLRGSAWYHGHCSGSAGSDCALVCLQKLLEQFHLGSCLPLFAEQQLDTVQVHTRLHSCQ